MPERRKRRPVEPGEFRDPINNFGPQAHEDELERSLVEDTVRAMATTPFAAVPPGTSVEEVMKLMAERDIACVTIIEDGKLLGVFSSRDVLVRVAEDFERLRGAPIRQVMTPDPVKVYVTDSPAKALNLMAVGGFRHIPILDVDEKVVGILGPRRVIDYIGRHLD